MIHHGRFIEFIVAAALLLLSACATIGFQERYQPTNADERLRFYLDALKRAREHGGTCPIAQGEAQVEVNQQYIEGEIRRLALEFQTHVPTLLANAVLCEEKSDAEGAQRYLDRLLAIQPGNVEAVCMRAQIAMEAGNLPFAREVLDRGIAIAPDRSELYETRAAVSYTSGRIAEANDDLAQAARLGAPAWRIAFNRGLAAEADGQRDQALAQYNVSLAERPDFEPARARARALQSSVVETHQ